MISILFLQMFQFSSSHSKTPLAPSQLANTSMHTRTLALARCMQLVELNTLALLPAGEHSHAYPRSIPVVRAAKRSLPRPSWQEYPRIRSIPTICPCSMPSACPANRAWSNPSWQVGAYMSIPLHIFTTTAACATKTL